MSRIDELIQKFCPDGVEYMQLGAIEDAELIKLGRGNVISKKDIAIQPGDYPIYSSSASGVGEFGRYGKYMFDDERLSWSVDGGGRFFYRHAHKYSVTNVSGWLKVLDSNRIDIKYLFYTLDSAWLMKKFDYTKKAHPSVVRNEYVIPIPPLEVQKEIVNILDKFTQLEAELSAELSAELEARRRQYEYYIDKLFSFDANSAIKTMPMSDIMSKITDGSHNPPSASADGLYPMISAKNINNGAINLDGARMLSEADFEFENRRTKASNGDLLMTIVGTVGRLAIIRDESKITFQRSVCVMTPKKELVSSDYVKYFLETTSIQKRLSADANGSAQKGLYLNQVKKIIVPIPPLDVQQRIVDALDKFDTLTNDISKGLPAEITARRKQYEYYRTKLLTFKELK